MTTEEERYRFDVLGYLIIEEAIDPQYLRLVQQSMDDWHAKAWAHGEVENRGGTTFFNVLDEDPRLLELVSNPRVMPFVQEMVDRPILEQFNVGYRWRGGESGVHAGHTPYQAINAYQTSEGKIYNNHLRCPRLLASRPTKFFPAGGLSRLSA